jgi:hypothetical protein
MMISKYFVSNFSEDCKLLQFDLDSVQKWYTENYVKINIFRTNIIYFIREANSVNFN